MRTCNQFSFRSGDSPTNKRLSYVSEDDLTSEHQMIMEALRSKTNSLMIQQRVASDYLSDIEI